MSGAGRNFVAFACGVPGSGKSHLLGTLGAQFPRRLVLDFVGEYLGQIKGAHDTSTLAETVDALRRARRKGPRWTVVACLDPEDALELLAGLAPLGEATDYGFSRAVGGLVLECGEIDFLAPNAGITPEARNLFLRGRHHRLSILAAATRPSSVNRIVTSLAHMICAFRQHEPRDEEYLGRLMRADAPAIIRALPERHYLRCFPVARTLETIDGAGRVVHVHLQESA